MVVDDHQFRAGVADANVLGAEADQRGAAEPVGRQQQQRAIARVGETAPAGTSHADQPGGAQRREATRFGQRPGAQRCHAGVEKRCHRRRRRGQRGEIFALAPGQEGVPICRVEPDCLRRRSAGACRGFVAGQRITRPAADRRWSCASALRSSRPLAAPASRPHALPCPFGCAAWIRQRFCRFPRLWQHRKGAVSTFRALYAR